MIEHNARGFAPFLRNPFHSIQFKYGIVAHSCFGNNGQKYQSSFIAPLENAIKPHASPAHSD